MWRLKRVRAVLLFFIARYGGFSSAMISFFPVNVGMGNVRTCFRLLAIVALDAVLAVRAWAIWERRKSILSLLLSTALRYILVARVMSLFLLDVCRYIESGLPYAHHCWMPCGKTVSHTSFSCLANSKLRRSFIVLIRCYELVNIGLVYQIPQLRSGGLQLQTCLHSMVASRIIMSIGASSSGPTDIENSRFNLEPIEFSSSTTRL
ncbi:hypothetical protein BDN71DRAFT_826047 [Pleurotus eryngii]|uniref:Uncharacterized protein n=1 Tax=Pleurotus eryngii TaxID=5323 RepID=A0A9P6DGX4_PLEER|nr:hypothetical protein BDN71DRAFT_826047 [Pleurotus eryngii]